MHGPMNVKITVQLYKFTTELPRIAAVLRISRCGYELTSKSPNFIQTKLGYSIKKNLNMFRVWQTITGHEYQNSNFFF